MKNLIAAITLCIFATTASFAQSTNNSNSSSSSRGTCTTKYKHSSYSPTRTKTTTTTKKGCDNQRKTYNMAFDSKTTYKPNNGTARRDPKTSTSK